MSYRSLAEMKLSATLLQRIAACAALEGVDQPENWVAVYQWKIISRSDWVDAWSYARDNGTANVNPDTGARDDVINDAMILAAVQAVLADVTPTS